MSFWITVRVHEFPEARRMQGTEEFWRKGRKHLRSTSLPYSPYVNYPSPKGNGLGRLSQKEPISVLQRPCIGSFCIFSLSNYGRIFLYHRKNYYSRTSSHWSMFPKCTACRLSTSTSCGKLFLMIMTPFSLSCFSPPPAMPPMVLSSVKTVPSL